MRLGRVIRKVTGNSGGPGDLELARSGSFALFSSLPDNPNLYLSVAEADGQHLVDSGPDIDPRSLAIAGGWVYWTRAGEPHSARIR
jgi:hypothetical protein